MAMEPTILAPPLSVRLGRALFHGFRTLAGAGGPVLDTLDTWQARIDQRRYLARMDERFLKDIGASRADALREIAKPFWRA